MQAGKFRRELKKNFILEESALENLKFDGLSEISLTFRIWEGNLTLDYQGDFEADFPESLLAVTLKNIEKFWVERDSSYVNIEQMIQAGKDLENRTVSDAGARTVFSVGFGERDRMTNGPEDLFEELRVQTMNCLISVVFMEAEIYGPQSR